MRTFTIFSAGDYGDRVPRVPEGSFVIAADGGLDELDQLGIVPDLIVGDFDSLKDPLPEGVETLRHPVMKDETDTELALTEALRRGAEKILIYGALGGRLDHSLANMQLLSGLARRGVEAYLLGPENVVTALSGGTLTFSHGFRGLISVFPWGGEARVTEQGLLYGLDREVLYHERPRGISNEFTGAAASIRVEAGTALILWGADNGELMPVFEKKGDSHDI